MNSLDVHTPLETGERCHLGEVPASLLFVYDWDIQSFFTCLIGHFPDMVRVVWSCFSVGSSFSFLLVEFTRLTVRLCWWCSGSLCMSWMSYAVKLWSYFDHALKKLTVLSSESGLAYLPVLWHCWSYALSFDNLLLILLGQLLIFLRSMLVSGTGSVQLSVLLSSLSLGLLLGVVVVLLLLSCSGTAVGWLRVHLVISGWCRYILVWLLPLPLSIGSSLVLLMLFTALPCLFLVSKRTWFLVVWTPLLWSHFVLACSLGNALNFVVHFTGSCQFASFLLPRQLVRC